MFSHVPGTFSSPFCAVNPRVLCQDKLLRSGLERSRPCGGRCACVQVGRGIVIRIWSGHKEVPYDPSTSNDAGELQRRNYSPGTIRCYLRAVADFARYFHRSPDQLRPQHIREYQAYLFRERNLDASTVTQKLAALRFFFVKTLWKPWSVGRTIL